MTGTALVHGAALWLAALIVPSLGAGFLGSICVCIGPEPLRQPLISILDADVNLGAVAPNGRFEAQDRCRPGARIDAPAEPMFALFQGRPLARRVDADDDDPVICARIGAGGRIGSAYLLRRSGHRPIDDAVLAGLRSLRFRPAQADGRARPAWHRIIVHLG